MEGQNYHWAFIAASNIIRERGEKDKYTLAAGITPSGTVHIGNFREIITVELVARALQKSGKQIRFIYSWDDYDVFRKVPKNMPEQEKLAKFLRMPITKVPNTFDTKAENFAEHNEHHVEEALPAVGVQPEFIHQYQKYKNCDYAEEINQALQKTAVIRTILNKYRKEDLPEDWLPVSIFCDKCGKDTVTKMSFIEDYHIQYICECGHEETFDIRKKGIIKLNWRIDWPMRWHYEHVDFEPGGKDHFAAGGSRDSAVEIIKEVYNDTPPHGFMYEWIAIKGGGEFSSSAGNVTTLQDVLSIYEPDMVRWLFAGTRPNATFNISFDADVIKLYEDFDKCERIYFKKEDVNEKEQLKQRIIYELSSVHDQPPEEMPFQPSFRHITNMLQTYDFDEEKTYSYFEPEVNTPFDEQRLKTRITCAKNWLENYAPEEFKFSIQSQFDKEQYTQFDEKTQQAISMTANVVKAFSGTDAEELATLLFTIPKELELETKTYFQAIYKMLINKEKGPKLATFILDIGTERVAKILTK